MTTGRLTDKGQHTEVIDLANPDSKCDPLPDYPIQIFGATGGLLQDSSPLVCGGFDGSDLGRISQCYIVDGNETLQTIDLNIYRLGVKIRKLKVDFMTSGTWHRVGQ